MISIRKYARKSSSLAIVNSFPNQEHTAESEFTRRLQICAERQSIELRIVECSSQVEECKADFLLTVHEVSPKLTSIPTIGAIWNPPDGIIHDPIRRQFIMSYDGYLSGAPSVTQFIKDQTTNFPEKTKPVADFRFFPSSPSGIARATSYNSLAYLGVHWDGSRHSDLISRLTRERLVTLYGPETAWRNAGSCYRGTIPFDGVSVIRRLAEHGIALCLHREAHLRADTPSMRIFEAASAGCLILSDSILFAQATFGETIFIIPDNVDRSEFIREKLSWARNNPRKAAEMAQASREIFDKHCSIDVLLPKIVNFGRSVSSNLSRKGRLAGHLFNSNGIDVFLILERFDMKQLKSAVRTINEQTHRSINLRVVYARDADKAVFKTLLLRRGIRLQGIAAHEMSLQDLQTLKSKSRSQYMTIISPDVTWSRWHLSSLINLMKDYPRATIGLSGSVEILGDDRYVGAPNYRGALARPIKEQSLLKLNLLQKEDLLKNPETVENLVYRSDWLMRLESNRPHRRGQNIEHVSSYDKTVMTGQVTCFSRVNESSIATSYEFC